MQAGHDDDDPEMLPCYRHPSRQSALRCLECDRPICVDCANHGPVGIKCPECSRTTRAARGAVPATRLARGIAAGAIVALALGAALFFSPVAFFRVILGYLIGIATGEAARRASGGYRDPHLAQGAAVAAALGVGALPIVEAFSVGSIDSYLFWSVIAGAAAAYAAFHRAS